MCVCFGPWLLGGLTSGEEVVRQYQMFMEIVVSGNSSFTTFRPGSERLDTLLSRHLKGKEQYAALWQVVQDLLLLSHGQASVERGFSVNKQTEDDNLAERSLIARRLVCDYVSSVGGLSNVEVSKPLLLCAASAHQQYRNFLEEEKRKEQQHTSSLKRRSLLDEIESSKAKKLMLEKDVVELTSDADSFAERAESACDLTWLAKSNSLRRTVKSKQEEITALAESLAKKSKELKLCAR